MIVWKWSLNWNPNDSAGSNNWTAINVTWVNWKMNWWAGFNGTNSGIYLWAATILPNTWNYAIEFILKWWVTSQSYWMIFIQEKLSTTQHSKTIVQDTNKIRYLNSNNTAWVEAGTIEEWKYYHILFSFSATNWGRLYVNWILWWSDTQVSTNTNPFWVNQTAIWVRNGANWFNGGVDELTLYDTEISQAEAKNKYLYYNWFI